METKKPGWARGITPESWACIDCGINTAPGHHARVEVEQAFALGRCNTNPVLHFDEHTELYMVKPKVWKAAGMNAGQGGFGDQNGDSGCLCIGCLEKRLGRTLKPKDFSRKHPYNSMPGTERLLSRRGD
jgi:hypothetical protein